MTSLLTSKAPDNQTLLDYALIITLLPHFLVMKLPMILFLIVALIMIWRQKTSKKMQLTLTVLGIVALAFSFISNYNFASFSKLLVFISLLVSLLVYAVMLQRMQRQINFYLVISPAMFLVLGFFFFNSIPMLIYALSALFLLVLLTLWQRMQSSLANAIRYTVMMFAFSLPTVALLFMVFPRISFQKATFGFKDDIVKRTGHDGTMHLDSKALLVPSEKVVMEVLFDGDIPPDASLYFRGTALYIDNTTSWEQLSRVQESRYTAKVNNTGTKVNYQVTLYPHKNRWLYALDIPTNSPMNSYISSDLMLTSNTPVTDIKRYAITSALEYTLLADESSILPEEAYETDILRDPELAERVSDIILEEDSDLQRFEKLQSLFRELALNYSMQPEPLDTSRPVDSFLFDTKSGYCVHFAAAFAKAARLADLPSRVITGFKANGKNRVNNYLVIKEKDAHAWVEVYIDDRGWIRFDPTTFAVNATTIEVITGAANPTQALAHNPALSALFNKVNMYYMYTKYMIDSWVLNYNRFKQKLIWKRLVEDGIYLAKFTAYALLLMIACIVIFVMMKKHRCEDQLSCVMRKLFTLLERHGKKRHENESVDHYLKRIADNAQVSDVLLRINTLYHQSRYGNGNLNEASKHIEKELGNLQSGMKSQ